MAKQLPTRTTNDNGNDVVAFISELRAQLDEARDVFGDEDKARQIEAFFRLEMWERNLYAMYLITGSGKKVGRRLGMDRRGIDRALREIEKKVRQWY